MIVGLTTAALLGALAADSASHTPVYLHLIERAGIYLDWAIDDSDVASLQENWAKLTSDLDNDAILRHLRAEIPRSKLDSFAETGIPSKDDRRGAPMLVTSHGLPHWAHLLRMEEVKVFDPKKAWPALALVDRGGGVSQLGDPGLGEMQPDGSTEWYMPAGALDLELALHHEFYHRPTLLFESVDAAEFVGRRLDKPYILSVRIHPMIYRPDFGSEGFIVADPGANLPSPETEENAWDLDPVPRATLPYWTTALLRSEPPLLSGLVDGGLVAPGVIGGTRPAFYQAQRAVADNEYAWIDLPVRDFLDATRRVFVLSTTLPGALVLRGGLIPDPQQLAWTRTIMDRRPSGRIDFVEVDLLETDPEVWRRHLDLSPPRDEGLAPVSLPDNGLVLLFPFPHYLLMGTKRGMQGPATLRGSGCVAEAIVREWKPGKGYVQTYRTL